MSDAIILARIVVVRQQGNVSVPALATKQQLRDLGVAFEAEREAATLQQGFLPKHAREVLADWQNREEIRIEPPSTRKGAFYLSYEDHEKKGRIIRISKVS